jgi:hypothetical protein
MNLTPANKPCNRCGGQISWDKKARQLAETNLPVNLDGTVHTCQPDQPQQEQSNNDITLSKDYNDRITFSNEDLAKYTVAARKEGIEQGRQERKNEDIERMHIEDIQAMNSLTAAINRIADLLTNTIKTNAKLTQ